MRDILSTHDTINDVLVHLFYEILDLQEKAVITEEYSDITNNDMHIIEQIGIEDEKTMSTVAKQLGITAGSLTTSMNGLVKKGYVLRERSEVDRRVVYIRLTEKGKKAFWHHAKFHQRMVQEVMEHLTDEELPILVKTLDKLTTFFRGFR